MYIRYQKMYSEMLGRDMEYKIYGHSGRPVLYIPCQDGRFYDFENFGMLDTLRPWIEDGRLTVFSIDTIDAVSGATYSSATVKQAVKNALK